MARVNLRHSTKFRRSVFFFTGAACLIGAVMYPIFIDPYLHPEKWKKIQKEARVGINREDIQPGGMKIWSNPFEPQKPVEVKK